MGKRKVGDFEKSPTELLRRPDRVNSWPPYKKHLWLNGFPMSKKIANRAFSYSFRPKIVRVSERKESAFGSTFDWLQR